MNFDVKVEFNLSKDIRSIERKFYRFYMEIIKDYFNLDKNFCWTTKAIPNHGKGTHNENNFCVFNDPGDLFLLCIQDTCLALRKFYSLLLEYVEFTKYLSKKRLITIYCASGESLFSAFGLCTVIDEYVEQYGFSHNTNTKNIEVIVIDKRENWRSLCSFIIESVNSCYKNVEIELEFIDERSSRLTYEAFSTRKEVDIVVMARYLSTFPYMRVRAHFLQVILNRMKDLSILFYVDENHEIYYNTLKHLVSKTDTLVEIMSKNTVYESLEDFENAEFRFLRNAVFKRVMFSVCIKCCGINDNISVEKDIKCDIISLREARRRIKQKILETLEKENLFTAHLDASEIKYLKIPSKSFLNASVPTTSPKISVKEKTDKSSKKSQNSNIYPLTSQITSFSQKNETKLLENSADTILFPSLTTVQVAQKITPNSEISTANKVFEKLQNTYNYLEDKRKPNDGTLKTSKDVDKFISKNSRRKHEYSGEGKTSNTEIVKTIKDADKFISNNSRRKHKYSGEGKTLSTETVKSNKAVDKLVSKNPQNRHKRSRKGKKSNAETDKSSKVPAQLIAINKEKKNKQLNINKQNAETVKSSKVVKESATENLKIKNISPGINKAIAGTTKRNNVIGILVTMNLRSKYIYSEEETTSENADNLELVKSSQKLASMKLENKNGYKSPHLSTEESLSMYANHLSDIYYSKYFDKGKLRTPKFK